MKSSSVSIVLLALTCSPSWAINKCVIDDRVVFQDAACPGKGEEVTVRPASGLSKPAGATESSPKKQLSEVQKIEDNVATSQKERRLRELEQREVPGADGAVQSHLQACKEEHDRLERAKARYVQNLYGKTDAAQRAAEQAAAASRCDTKDRELRARSAQLKLECQQLGGCK